MWTVPAARANSDKALALDRDLAEPLSLLGYLDVIEGVDFDGGMRRMERARELGPNNPRILTRLANIAVRNGKLDDALHYCQQALKSDPLSANAHAIYGNTCYFAGRLEEAVAMRRKVLELSPGWLSGHFNLGKILLARNDAAAALAEMRQERSAFWRLTGLALVHHATGERCGVRRGAQGPDAVGPEWCGVPARAGARVTRRNDLAFQWLDRAAATHDSGFVFTGVDPLLANLHADSRWGSFLSRNGRWLAQPDPVPG